MSLKSGFGRLLGLLVSHSQSTAQSITLKDDTATLLKLWVHPNRSPIFINLGMGERDKLDGIEFTKSLVANAGLNSMINKVSAFGIIDYDPPQL